MIILCWLRWRKVSEVGSAKFITKHWGTRNHSICCMMYVYSKEKMLKLKSQATYVELLVWLCPCTLKVGMAIAVFAVLFPPRMKLGQLLLLMWWLQFDWLLISVGV